jgi:hypothetical protein
MELAVAGQADYLVTRNVKDLRGGRASTSAVVTATIASRVTYPRAQ